LWKRNLRGKKKKKREVILFRKGKGLTRGVKKRQWVIVGSA